MVIEYVRIVFQVMADFRLPGIFEPWLQMLQRLVAIELITM